MNNYKRYTLNDTLESEKRALFNVLSTFAGGGGSSTGYRLDIIYILCYINIRIYYRTISNLEQ